MTTVLTSEEFASLFQSFKESAFRLETMDRYTVPEEAEEYQRFLSGGLVPTTADSEWAQFVRNSTSQGKLIQRVHVIVLPLTPYLKYEIEWGYVYTSAAGEDIYLLDRATLSPELRELKDFWLFDDETLVVVRYDSEGRFLQGEREDSVELVRAHIDARARLVSQAISLRSFLAQTRSA
jgi:hypothetical protein